MVIARRLALPSDWYRRGIARVVDTLPPYDLRASAIEPVIDAELVKFERAVAQGLRALHAAKQLDGKVAFDLFQTHGIPYELTLELASSTGVTIDQEDFAAAFERH